MDEGRELAAVFGSRNQRGWTKYKRYNISNFEL